MAETVLMDKNKLLREALLDILVALHAKDRVRWQDCEQSICIKAKIALNKTNGT